jgi:hypothetical protein
MTPLRAGLPGRLVKIISGGQTGADRAALDVAIALGIACGGFVPRGRRAEDGPLPAHYPLRETASAAYEVRTRENVLHADATLILTRGRVAGGTALTVAIARDLGRPFVVVDLAGAADVEAVREWLARERVRVLNVAGPRESSHPGIYEDAGQFLRRLLAADSDAGG